MKYKLTCPLLVISILITLKSFSQTEPCFFDTYQHRHNVQMRQVDLIISNVVKNSALYKKAANNTIKTIPVVVHVIHTGGAENISDAQVQSQIVALNEDFRKKAGTNGDGNGVDSEMEFCLAKLTPDGKCTNGIVRIQSSLSNHQTYQRALLKQISSWDNTHYLNIYVVKNINNGSGTVGYSSYPGGPPDEDGIVVRYEYFGRIGTASATLGRTTTHEVGHWLGLRHTFNGGCGADTCSDGDFVCDTPPAANPNYGCPAINSCTNDIPNINDQVQNYMDYSNDACKNMFTAGQKTRMYAALNTIRAAIFSDTNITSAGCDSGFVNGPCNVIADFTINSQTICVNNPVLFTNKTLNDPTSVQWYFPGGSPSTSTATNPSVTYSTIGSYSVKLIATGSNGTDSIIKNNFITVTTPPVGQPLPYFEDFETSIFPANGIIIDNPDMGITWERDTTAVEYAGNGAAKINNLINTNYGQSDAILLPPFDFTSFVGTPYLNFKWAYAKSDPNYSDELIVLVSKDCGVNWIQAFYRTGVSMTTGPTQTTPYVPDSNTVWKIANINLSTYSTYSNVQIKIVNVTDGGNNLYIDNINLGSELTGINERNNVLNDIRVFPNPASNKIHIAYLATGKEIVSIDLLNAVGQEIKSRKENTAIGANEVVFDIDNTINSGLYIMRMKINNQIVIKRISIIK